MAKIINEKNYMSMSEKLMLQRTKTKSLHKLNLRISTKENKENNENIAYIAAYAFYNKDRLFINAEKFKELGAEIKNFDEKNVLPNSIYFKAKRNIEDELLKHRIQNEQKKEFIEYVKNIKDEKGISYKRIFETLEINYSNGYNFFVKGDVRMFKFERIISMKSTIKKLL